MRADGSLAVKARDLQQQKLLDEAVDTVNYRVDLNRYRWFDVLVFRARSKNLSTTVVGGLEIFEDVRIWIE